MMKNNPTLVSPAGVKKSGYWCAGGERLVTQLYQAMKLDPKTDKWLSVLDVLDAGGIGLALQGLVAARIPAQGDFIANTYGQALYRSLIKDYLAQESHQDNPHDDNSRIVSQPDRHRASESKSWRVLANESVDPGISLTARSLFLLLVPKIPIAMRCLHATDMTLNAGRFICNPVTTLESTKLLLKESINACPDQ